jgi:hypothetical protein
MELRPTLLGLIYFFILFQVEQVATKRGSKKKSDSGSEKTASEQEAIASKSQQTEEEDQLDPIQAAQEVVPADINDDSDYQQTPRSNEPIIEREITVRPSDSLFKKLKEQAEEEGLGLEEYCMELLAEAAVVRAWELVERKLTMRGGNAGGGNQQQQHRNNQNRHGNHGNNNNRRDNKGGGHNNRRGMSHSRYQNIMDDKATFLEYVRNQERKNNR